MENEFSGLFGHPGQGIGPDMFILHKTQSDLKGFTAAFQNFLSCFSS